LAALRGLFKPGVHPHFENETALGPDRESRPGTRSLGAIVLG
jgi:hypothetical protein